MLSTNRRNHHSDRLSGFFVKGTLALGIGLVMSMNASAHDGPQIDDRQMPKIGTTSPDFDIRIDDSPYPRIDNTSASDPDRRRRWIGSHPTPRFGEVAQTPDLRKDNNPLDFGHIVAQYPDLQKDNLPVPRQYIVAQAPNIRPHNGPYPQPFSVTAYIGPPQITELISSWGMANGSPADLNQDSYVDDKDLRLLLMHWGEPVGYAAGVLKRMPKISDHSDVTRIPAAAARPTIDNSTRFDILEAQAPGLEIDNSTRFDVLEAQAPGLKIDNSTRFDVLEAQAPGLKIDNSTRFDVLEAQAAPRLKPDDSVRNDALQAQAPNRPDRGDFMLVCSWMTPDQLDFRCDRDCCSLILVLEDSEYEYYVCACPNVGPGTD